MQKEKVSLQFPALLLTETVSAPGGIDMQKIDVAAGPSSSAVNFSLPANFDPANLQISIKSIRLEIMPKLGVFLNLVKEQEGQKNLQLASVK